MARRVNLSDYGVRESLRPEHLGKATHAVLEIAEVDPDVMVTGDDGDRKSLVIRFAEFPDVAFWPNKTGLRYLVAELGEDVDKWIGRKVPLQVVTTQNPRTHEPVENLWICKPETWEKHIAASAKGRAKRAPAKRTGKRAK